MTAAEVEAMRATAGASDSAILSHYRAVHVGTNAVTGARYFLVAEPSSAEGLPGAVLCESYATLPAEAEPYVLEAEWVDALDVDPETLQPRRHRTKVADGGSGATVTVLQTGLVPAVFEGMEA